MLNKEEAWSLQLRQRFFDIEVNRWRISSIQYFCKSLEQCRMTIIQATIPTIRNSTNQTACAKLRSQFRLVYRYPIRCHYFTPRIRSVKTACFVGARVPALRFLLAAMPARHQSYAPARRPGEWYKQ